MARSGKKWPSFSFSAFLSPDLCKLYRLPILPPLLSIPFPKMEGISKLIGLLSEIVLELWIAKAY